MADARWSSHPRVAPDCPVCDRPLPLVVVDVDAWTGHPLPGVASRRVLLQLHVRTQDLDGPWWSVARAAHPTCIPPDVGVPWPHGIARHGAEQCHGLCPEHREAAS